MTRFLSAKASDGQSQTQLFPVTGETFTAKPKGWTAIITWHGYVACALLLTRGRQVVATDKRVGEGAALAGRMGYRMLCYLTINGVSFSEPTQEAEDAWTELIYRDFSRTLMAEANAWWVKTKTKPNGTIVRCTLVYVGGGPEYRKRCEQVAACNYEGFHLA